MRFFTDGFHDKNNDFRKKKVHNFLLIYQREKYGYNYLDIFVVKLKWKTHWLHIKP